LRSPPLVFRRCLQETSSGISPAFAGLFLTEGQVAHVLLTRSPLYSSPCGDFLARLACVRHAASVRSEPGSNSPSTSLALLREISDHLASGGRGWNRACVHPQASSNDIQLSENRSGGPQHLPPPYNLERPVLPVKPHHRILVRRGSVYLPQSRRHVKGFFHAFFMPFECCRLASKRTISVG
jgi:hypothetical protein